MPQTEPVSYIENQVFDRQTQAKRVYVVNNPTGEVDFEVLDIEESPPITYVGKQDKNGVWMVVKIDESVGIVIRYAGSKNNPTMSDYATAWSNRATLTYGTYSEAIE